MPFDYAVLEIERVDVPTHGSLTTGVGSSNMQIFVNTLTRETITLDEEANVSSYRRHGSSWYSLVAVTGEGECAGVDQLLVSLY